MLVILRFGLFVCLAIGSLGAWAQVGIGTAVPKTRTILELENNGVPRVFQLPRINSSARTIGTLSGLSSDYAGSVVVDTTSGTGTALYLYTGNRWVAVNPFYKDGNLIRQTVLGDSVSIGQSFAKEKLFVNGNIGLTYFNTGRRIYVDTVAGNNPGAPLTIEAGRGGGTSGNGGALTLRAGAALNGSGGPLVIQAGNSTTGGSGGLVSMSSGNASSLTGNSGSISITTGSVASGSTSGSTGSVTLGSRSIATSTTTGSTGNVTLGSGDNPTSVGGSTGSLTLSTGNANTSVGNNSTGSINIRTGNLLTTANRRAGGITIAPGNSAGATYGAELRLFGGNTTLPAGSGGKIRLQAGTAASLLNYGNITLNPLGGGVAVGNDTVPEYVAFQVKSPASGKGLLLPQVSTSDLTGGDLSGLTPVIHEGMIVADTASGGFGLAYYNGGDWYHVMTTAEDQTLIRNGFRLTTISTNDSVGIGSLAPFDRFSVGTTGQFRVNASGGITGDRLSLATLSAGGPVRANAVSGLLQTTTINLGSTDVSGVLPVARGGTGVNTLTANGVLTAAVGGTSIISTTLNDGQLLIGRTGLAPQAATLTAGAGISITNGAGSITITNTAAGVANGTATNNTLRWNGSAWVESNFLVNTGTRIGINDITPDFPVDATSADLNTIRAVNTSLNGYALRGEHTNTSGVGAGVFGTTSSAGTGAAGVFGLNNSGLGGGVRGESTIGYGVRGISSGAGVGVYGENTQTAVAGRGVVGVSVSPIAGSAGVRGEHNVGTGTGVGVSGVTTSTTAGVAGVAGEHTGTSGAGFGVYGQTFSNSSLAAGVIGRNTAGTGDGVRGETATGTGVRGTASGAGTGVIGENTNTVVAGTGVLGTSVSTVVGSAGVRGEQTATNGAVYGVYGSTNSINTLSAGVFGVNNTSDGGGVRGESVNGIGVRGISTGTGAGLLGQHTGTGAGNGLFASTTSNDLSATGVFGQLSSSSAIGAGVRGTSTSAAGNGILAVNSAVVTTGAALRVEGASRLLGPVMNGFSSSSISNYTILAADNVVRLATGTLSAQVPNISSNYVGRVVYLINNVGSSITISAPGSVSFNGSLGGSQLFGNGQVALCICVGTDAWVVRIF